MEGVENDKLSAEISEDATQNKHQVDHNIAQDSYNDQIASLDIDNTKISQPEGRHSQMTGGDMRPEDDQTQIEADADAANDSDEEFKQMDERIANQVIYEKRKQQVENGAKLMKICSSVGRCPICTLKPPCNHRNKADQSIHPDLLAMSPMQVKKGLANLK